MGLVKRQYTDRETVITAENMNDIQDAILALEDGLFAVDNDKSGEIINIADAAKRGFRGLNIFGKTTQSGTPTPDAPIDLVSAGNGGILNVAVARKNLWNHANDTVDMSSLSDWGTAIWRNAAVVQTLKPKTTYTMKCSVTCLSVPTYASVYSDQCGFVLYSSQGTGKHTHMAVSIGGGALVAGEQRTLQGTFTTPEDISDFSMDYRILHYTQRFLQENGTAVFARVRVDDVQLEIGNTASDYVPYTGQQLSISTPNGLPGIPVAEGGNYTDANGQQWICDEIDFARGVYIRRTKRVTVNGSGAENWIVSEIQSVSGATRFDASIAAEPRAGQTFCLCNAYSGTNSVNRYAETCWCNSAGTIPSLQFRICTAYATTVEELRNSLQANPVDFIYQLATPIETPLPAEELAAFSALRTYKDHTTVTNDASAYMELEYVMDAKKYFDGLASGGASARLSNVTLRASAWTGADSLYSQVVTIDGITEYSKVDLLPSVEQLAIFHNKDVAFVTENEDGVVTVYAIGDKPTQDYTMQAQITEVEV